MKMPRSQPARAFLADYLDIEGRVMYGYVEVPTEVIIDLLCDVERETLLYGPSWSEDADGYVTAPLDWKGELGA